MPKPYRRYFKFSWKMPFAALCVAVGLITAYAAERTAEFKTVDSEEVLPDIEAKTYEVEVKKRSRSLRVYLIQQTQATGEANAEPLPLPGKILLFSQGKTPTMAFRVLKQYSDRQQFAASRVKLYGEVVTLELGDRFEAAEKIADLSIPEYSLEDKELDRMDLKELEADMDLTPVPEFDPSLDEGTSAPPQKQEQKKETHSEKEKPVPQEDPEVEEEDIEAATPDDIRPFDTDKYWVSLQLAYLANTKLDASSVYYTGGGLLLGYTLDKKVFAKSSSLQDSISLEAGFFYYKVLGYEVETDSFTLLPVIGTLRYNLMFSEGFGAYLYGGMIKNMMMGSPTGSQAAIDQLSTVHVAAGAGLLFRLGPKWFMRTDLGIDRIGLGLTLRF